MKVVLVLSVLVIYACLIQTSTSAVLRDVTLNMTEPSSIDIVKPGDSQIKQDMEKVAVVLEDKTTSPSAMPGSESLNKTEKAKLPELVLKPEEEKLLEEAFKEALEEAIKETVEEVIEEAIDEIIEELVAEDSDSDSEDDKSTTKETKIMNIDMKVIPKEEKVKP